jgi:hypothetical protein
VVWALAPRGARMARPAASARRAGQWQPDFASRRILASRKKGEQNRRATHVISSSHRSLADLSGCYARGEDGVNQGTTRRQKEKICIVIFFRQTKSRPLRMRCSIGKAVQIDSVGRRESIAMRIRAKPTCGSSNQGPLSAVPKSIG